ncbi:MAG: PilZ domain-containing protein [Terriglobales bacterium]
MTETTRNERRCEQRIRFEAPATIAAAEHRIAASTKDISQRGLFCFTDAKVEVGSDIDILLMLPEEVGLPVSGMVCCHGRIVRSKSDGGQYGMAVEIERLEPVPMV